MKHFPINDSIIGDLSAMNETTLVRANHSLHDLLQSIQEGFSNYLVTNITEADRAELGNKLRVLCFGNQNQ